MEIARLIHHPYTRPALLYAAWLGMFFLLFFRSWVSEDAYITLRVVDNFVHGYGLRWNITERVQVYTHPLWLLLHLPFAMLWSNFYHLNMALSLFCASFAVAIVLLTFRKSASVTLACFMLPLFLSKCFVEYAGSGLETALSYLLFAILGYVLTHWREQRYFMLALSFCSALLLLNRLDHLLMIAPLFAYLSWRDPNRFFSPKNLSSMALGMLPLLSWFTFSLWYYGFLFPNTKYAKLDTGLPLSDYIYQGLQYGFIWLTQDTLSALLLLTTLVLAWRRGDAFQKALAVGILINVCYVVAIGGDYMMGRFFAFIFFVACWLFFSLMPTRIRPDILFAIFACIVTAAAASHIVRDIRDMCSACIPIKGRVLDASRTFGGNALFSQYWPPVMRSEGQYKFARDGKEAAKESPPPIKSLRYIGMFGFYAGPNVVLVDELALADPLLARLPARKGRAFYVGHYYRRVPHGYIDAVKTGDLSGMNPHLAQYYDKIRLITQGDLNSKERLLTILRFNLGEYEHIKFAYLKKPR
jgi:arabinofuranosyltransferase